MAAWCNQLLAFCISLRLRGGPNYNLIPSPQGVALDIRAPGRGGSAPAAGEQQYIFQAHGNPGNPDTSGVFPVNSDADYILCNPIGGGDQVKILKPHLLRFSIASRNVQGQIISYTKYDTQGQSRMASNSFASVQQIITPQYALGDEIWAVSVSWVPPTGGPAIKVLIENNRGGRVFAGPNPTG